MSKIFAIVLIISMSILPLYAQDMDPTTTNEETVTEEIQTETQKQTDEGTLSQDIQVEETQSFNFLTILFAVITPVLLIVVAYLLIKMTNK